MHIFIKQTGKPTTQKLEIMMTTKTYQKQYQPKGGTPKGTTGYVNESDIIFG